MNKQITTLNELKREMNKVWSTGVVDIYHNDDSEYVHIERYNTDTYEEEVSVEIYHNDTLFVKAKFNGIDLGYGCFVNALTGYVAGMLWIK